DIFTFIEHESLWVSVSRELQGAAQEFAQNPKKFILDLFRPDPLQAKRKMYLRVGATSAMFVWVLGSIIYLGFYYWKPSVVAPDAEQLQKIADLTPLAEPTIQAPKAQQRAGGGGGGGRHEMTPPSRGRLPKASLQAPIVAPSAHPPAIEHPSLPVVP